MTRAATAPELVKLASDGQWSSVYAHVFSSATVFAGRVNKATIVTDKLIELPFDGVTTGSYSAILPGMTVLIGSAAGLSDRGIGWARKAPTSKVLYIGETSAISVVDNDYITVLAEFGVWKKVPRSSSGGWWCNTDEAYTDQMTVRKPTVIMGGDIALELTDANVATTLTLSGAASYVTTCTGATVTNGTTNAPIVTIATVGEYLVKVVATAANAKTSTTYRSIYVWSAASPPTNMLLQSNSGDGTGWTATIENYESQSTVRDRAKVIIFSKDYYGNVLGSIGSLTGCENITATGCIDGETIVYDKDNGSVAFEIKPASYWLDQMQSEYEIPLTPGSGTWLKATSVTADVAIWNLLENYTTALNCMDAIYTGDTRTSSKIVAPLGSIWGQITSVLDTLPGYATINQYGQFIAGIDIPLIPYADRAAIPVVVTLTKDDFESVDITRPIPQTAQTIITGLLSDGKAVCSIGGGRVPGRWGQLVTGDGYLAASQDQLNVLAGSMFARDNTPYRFSIRNLCGNNRLIEPYNRIGLTLLATDNLRGVAYSGYAIVRSVIRSFDAASGGWTIDIDADAETQAISYCNGEIPVNKDPSTPPIDIPFPHTPPFGFPTDPGTVPDPIPDPPIAGDCVDGGSPTGGFILQWDQPYLDGSDPTKLSTKAYKRCTIRSATATYPTTVNFAIVNKGLAYNHLHCYGIDSTGARIATASSITVITTNGDVLGMMASFSEASAITVAGFEITLDAGEDATAIGYTNILSHNFEQTSTYGTTTSITDTIAEETPASGIAWYVEEAAGSCGWFGVSWSSKTHMYIPGNSTGAIYVSIYASSTTNGRPVKFRVTDLAGGWKLDQETSLIGLYKIYDFTPGNDFAPMLHVDALVAGGFEYIGLPDVDATAYMNIKWILSATYPVRSAAMQGSAVFNVCPAVAA